MNILKDDFVSASPVTYPEFGIRGDILNFSDYLWFEMLT